MSRDEQQTIETQPSVNDAPAKYTTVRPQGAYYDMTANAWFVPNQDLVADNGTDNSSLFDQKTSPSDFTIDTTGALGGGSKVSGGVNTPTSNAGSMTITGDRPVTTPDSDGNTMLVTADRPTTSGSNVITLPDGTQEMVITTDRPKKPTITSDDTPEVVITSDRPVPPVVTPDDTSEVVITSDRPVKPKDPVITPDVITPPVVTPPPPPPVSPPPPKVEPPAPPVVKLPTTTPSGGGYADAKLDSSPQFLAGAPVYQKALQLAALHQLFNSLTPEMRQVLIERGIEPPKYEHAEAKQEEPARSELDRLAGDYSGKQYGAKFLADGGYVSDNEKLTNEAGKMINGLMPKFGSSPSFLSAAPVSEQKSRLGALTHLNQGILKTAKPLGGLAHGGLPQKYAEAAPKGHKPEFITGLTGYYASGDGTGQSDDIPAMLHDGDYVIDADAVAALGDGSSKAGAEALAKFQNQVPHRDGGPVSGKPVPAKIADGEYVFPAAFVSALGGGDNKQGSKMLDAMREELREHKRSAPTSKIPPKAKSPLDYLKMAKG